MLISRGEINRGPLQSLYPSILPETWSMKLAQPEVHDRPREAEAFLSADTLQIRRVQGSAGSSMLPEPCCSRERKWDRQTWEQAWKWSDLQTQVGNQRGKQNKKTWRGSDSTCSRSSQVSVSKRNTMPSSAIKIIAKQQIQLLLKLSIDPAKSTVP